MSCGCGSGLTVPPVDDGGDYEQRRQGTPERLASRRAHYHRKGWLTQYKRRLRTRIQQRTEER